MYDESSMYGSVIFQGFADNRKGRTIYWNPYPATDVKWFWWRQGWLEAVNV